MYHFTWLENIPGVAGAFGALGIAEYAAPILHAWLLCFLLVGAALLGRMSLSRVAAQGDLKKFVPDSGLTMRNVWELFTSALYNLIHSILPNDSRNPYFFGLLAGLFVFVLFGNLMGLVPGFAAPTGDLNTNLAMSLTVLVVFNVAGLMTNGTRHITHLFGPVWWLAPLLFFVEGLGMFVVRPVSLALRLTGNMFGDHMVFGIMSDLVPPIWPSIFLGLGTFVSFIQALVFTLLSAVYIALATAHEEDHH